jgi:hypothetical protein
MRAPTGTAEAAPTAPPRAPPGAAAPEEDEARFSSADTLAKAWHRDESSGSEIGLMEEEGSSTDIPRAEMIESGV